MGSGMVLGYSIFRSKSFPVISNIELLDANGASAIAIKSKPMGHSKI